MDEILFLPTPQQHTATYDGSPCNTGQAIVTSK